MRKKNKVELLSSIKSKKHTKWKILLHDGHMSHNSEEIHRIRFIKKKSYSILIFFLIELIFYNRLILHAFEAIKKNY